MTPTTEHLPTEFSSLYSVTPCPAPSLRAGSFIQERRERVEPSRPLTCAATALGNPSDAAQVFSRQFPFAAPHSERLARLERRIAGRVYGHGAVRHLHTRFKFIKARCAALGAE